MPDPSNIFTIPAGVPFTDALAAGVLDLVGSDPEALAAVTVLLPTRRACRALREGFLRRSGGRPLLLPRLLPLGDVDEDELLLSSGDEGVGGVAALDIQPAIGGLARQLALARLVSAFEGEAATLDQAVRLAGELARLIDQVETERLDFARLADLVPDAYADHWQKTLLFLRIVTEAWPEELRGRGLTGPATRRNRLIEAQGAAWRENPPLGPVIAAGSTGSVPATADLLEVIAGLPQGFVVLPGFDMALATEAGGALDPAHPQYGMLNLLDRLGVAPRQVRNWPHPRIIPDRNHAARADLIRRVMLPAPATARWREEMADMDAALAGVSLIEAETEGVEAGAIALVLREALETPGRTAALVTPDRRLARRVVAELERFGVAVDDSAGRPLAATPAGAFLRLCARAAMTGFEPIDLLALFKHPLAAGGRNPAVFRALAREVERAVLRGPRPEPGLEGLCRAIDDRHAHLRAEVDAWAALADPFVRAGAEGAPLRDLLAAHVAFAEALATDDTEDGAARLWAGEDGEAAAAFVAELLEAAPDVGPAAVPGRRYPALLDCLMAGRVVRPKFGAHPRLAIWGLLEARLQRADVMILGGLNEGAWPPEVEPGPWMSRPMMAAFGLPPPERRIGLAAHDFAQAFAAPRLILSRAGRVDGAPTVPSRWLQRLDACLGGKGLAPIRDRRWGAWAAALDRSDERVRPVPPPLPRPPLEMRPRRLSVTRIETWIRDPYAIFARYILGLEPLAPIDADPDAAERGIAVHDALERFVREFPDHLPDDAHDRLIEIGRRSFSGVMSRPGVRAFWWPRFERIARWFIDHERALRQGGARPIRVEAKGEMKIEAPGGSFILTARADRIDRLADGGLAVVDYKTGTVPSENAVRSGLSPQLGLEAAMVADKAFEDLPAAQVRQLIYVKLSGGREPGTVRLIDDDVPALAAETLERLRQWIARFDDPATPYPSRRAVQFERRPGDYDHLARVREWSGGGGEGGE